MSFSPINNLKIICFLSCLNLIFTPSSITAEELVITSDIQFSLAESFLQDGENYRAITEYKKFLYLFPDSENADLALFKMAGAYQSGEEYGKAALYYRKLREDHLQSRYLPESHYLEGLCYWKQMDTANAMAIFDEVVNLYQGEKILTDAIKARSIIAFESGDTFRSRLEISVLLDRFPDHPGVEGIQRAGALLDNYDKRPRKSPAVAGLMSAMLPGSGYFYAGSRGDGVSAFVINALFIAGLVEAIEQENDGMAILAGGFGLPFYIGNIYGSANAARKWNLSFRKENSRQIYLALGFDF